MKEIFDPYVLGHFDSWPMGTPLPHADVLNEWSPTLILNNQRNLLRYMYITLQLPTYLTVSLFTPKDTEVI